MNTIFFAGDMTFSSGVEDPMGMQLRQFKHEVCGVRRGAGTDIEFVLP